MDLVERRDPIGRIGEIAEIYVVEFKRIAAFAEGKILRLRNRRLERGRERKKEDQARGSTRLRWALPISAAN
ncbi:MAG TPA: hypothetical protein VKV77_07870 [Methylovirgula sp.]|nr:hypothetical protein [Methylovirgula sp.]